MMFQLEIHLPFFVWKEGRPRPKSNANTKLKWKDLSFLQLKSLRLRTGKTYGICKGQFSLAIYGLNHWRWVAYAFDNNHFAERFENDLDKAEFASPDFQEDLIISGSRYHDANIPLRDPREYYLKVLKSRTGQTLQSWEYLVWRIERCIEEYVCWSIIIPPTKVHTSR